MAAGSISPEKVKELLSSFLVTSNKLNEKDKVATHNKIDKDGSQDEQTTETAVSSSNSSTNILRSYHKFLERLDTFSTITWFGKPLDLSPIICARYGWENVDTDMLLCVCCKVFLSGQLPSKLNSDSYEESLTKLKQNLLASHDKFCVLAANPCPEHFCHVPVDEPVSLLSGFTERVRSLSKVQDKLPHIQETDLVAQGYDTGQGGAYCKRNLVPGIDASPEAVVLAFTGWTCSASNEDVLTCSMCRRQIGLWNFTSHSSTAFSPEPSNENNSEDENEDGEVKAKRRKTCPSVKETLNPVGEHHHWCPWTHDTPLPPPPPSSSGAATSHSCGDKRQQTAPAYIVALRCIAPGLMDNNKGLANTMKTSPVVEGLRYFRRVIRAWSSPKVQMASSPS